MILDKDMQKDLGIEDTTPAPLLKTGGEPKAPERVELTNAEIMALTQAHKFQYFFHFKSFAANGYELINGILYKVKR